MVKYVIDRGPLYGHFGEPGAGGFTRKELFAQGLVLEPTGKTYRDSKGVTWGEFRTPWMVREGRGSVWFHMGYVKAVEGRADTLQALVNRWARDVDGVGLDVDKRHDKQCVDGAKDWVSLFGVDPMGSYGHGKDFARGVASAYRDKFDFYLPSQTTVKAADTLSYGRPYGVNQRTGAFFGHVAVALEDSTGSTHLVMNQDGFNGKTVMHTSNLNTSYIIGIARPKHMPTVTSEPKPETYIIKPGDTLWGIKKKYDTSVAVLLSLNPGLVAENLPVGKEIVVAR